MESRRLRSKGYRRRFRAAKYHHLLPDTEMAALKEEAFEAFTAMVDFLRIFGDMLVKVGKFERSVGRSIDEYFRDVLKPDALAEALKEAPPEVTSEFFLILLEMSALSGLKNVERLPPDEKIKVGNKFKELSKRIRNLLKKVTEG